MFTKLSALKILIIFFFCNNYFVVNANITGIPFIKNYKAKEYKGKTQNYAIIEDDRGLIYVANGKGLLEYDGKEWRNIDLGITSAVISFAKDANGRIYIGCVNDFGYLSHQANGKISFNSLLNLLPADKRNFADVWSIHIFKNEVFFRSYEYIFKYNKEQI